MKGQAYFLRAYGYFFLANTYAQAYNEAKPTDLCVPINLGATPSLKRFGRATIKEVWDLISSDIEQSVALLSTDKVKRPVFEVSYKAALLLATRIALYREDFDKAIVYGEKFLEISPDLYDISAITASQNEDVSETDDYFLSKAKNREILLNFDNQPTSLDSYFYGRAGLFTATFSVSVNAPDALIDRYTIADKRLKYCFVPPTGIPGSPNASITWVPKKINNYNRFGDIFMRSSEVYLTLVEAYARKNNPDHARAIDLLNKLRVHRIEGYTDLSAADFPDQQALIRFIWEERRRELCFEELHRWWDLRRTGQPALEHKYFGNTYRLNVKDPAYVLNFPKKELEFNPNLVPNIRPVRNPN